MDLILMHLNGLHCSGRAVKFEPLDPDTKDDILQQAVKAIGSDGTYPELKRKEWKLGVLHMVKQVSDSLAPGTDPNGADVKWKKFTPATLEEAYVSLFGPKDHALLMAAYQMYHEVSNEEINSIVGKALMVSEG